MHAATYDTVCLFLFRFLSRLLALTITLCLNSWLEMCRSQAQKLATGLPGSHQSSCPVLAHPGNILPAAGTCTRIYAVARSRLFRYNALPFPYQGLTLPALNSFLWFTPNAMKMLFAPVLHSESKYVNESVASTGNRNSPAGLPEQLVERGRGAGARRVEPCRVLNDCGRQLAWSAI